MVLLWIASRQDNITNTPMKILSLPYPECKWLLIPDNFFPRFCISFILSTSYPLQMKCLGKLSRSLGGLFFSSFWTTGKKQQIAALHSLHVYFHQVTPSSVYHCKPAVVPCFCGTRWGAKQLLQRKHSLTSGRKV